MNDLYFACTDCRVFTDAGYRWCYWQLEEPGVVRRGEAVDVTRVLACAPYWNPGRSSETAWLNDEVLPSVRAFLQQHAMHNIVFWEDNHLPEDYYREWLQVGFLARPLPRYFVEVLGYADFQQVLDWRERERAKPDGPSFSFFSLSGTPDREAAFREAFERLRDRRS